MIEWFDLLVIQGTLKSLQHHSSTALILQHSAFFIVLLSHLYMTTGKTIALTRQPFVGKITSLLFNMLSRFLIAFLPRSKASFNFMTPVTTICSDFGTQENSLSQFPLFPHLLGIGAYKYCWALKKQKSLKKRHFCFGLNCFSAVKHVQLLWKNKTKMGAIWGDLTTQFNFSSCYYWPAVRFVSHHVVCIQ